MVDLNHQSFIDSLIFKMHQLIVLVSKFVDARLQSQVNLSLSQFLILSAISCPKHPNNQKAIATSLDMSAAAVSKQIEWLELNKIIKRSQLQIDRRQHLWEMTNIGRQKFELAVKEIQAITDQIESVMNDEEKTIIEKSLDKMFTQIANSKSSKN